MTLFEKIIAREIPADIVYEDELALAFRDINPVAPVHVLVIPKKPIPRIGNSTDSDAAVMGHLMRVIAVVAEREGVAADGYRVVSNNGDAAGQTVDHLHFHLLGGRSMTWPPG